MKYLSTVLLAASALYASVSASPLIARDDKSPYYGGDALGQLGLIKDSFFLETAKCDLSIYNKKYDVDVKLLIIVVADIDKKEHKECDKYRHGTHVKRDNKWEPKHENKHDGKWDPKHDNKHDGKWESKHENKHENKHDNKWDPKHDKKHDGKWEPKHDNKHDGKWEPKHDNKHDGKWEPKHENKHDNKWDPKHDNQHENHH